MKRIENIIPICLISIISIVFGYLLLYVTYKTAPEESIEWLKLNPIWNYIIIGCFSFSNTVIGIKNGKDIWKSMDELK